MNNTNQHKRHLYLVSAIGQNLFFVRADNQEEANTKALQAVRITECVFNEIPDGYGEFVGDGSN